MRPCEPISLAASPTVRFISDGEGGCTSIPIALYRRAAGTLVKISCPSTKYTTVTTLPFPWTRLWPAPEAALIKGGSMPTSRTCCRVPILYVQYVPPERSDEVIQRLSKTHTRLNPCHLTPCFVCCLLLLPIFDSKSQDGEPSEPKQRSPTTQSGAEACSKEARAFSKSTALLAYHYYTTARTHDVLVRPVWYQTPMGSISPFCISSPHQRCMLGSVKGVEMTSTFHIQPLCRDLLDEIT
ncbi:hypothetical protein GGI35DRAFT_314352 [Trichoderma velutinum]